MIVFPIAIAVLVLMGVAAVVGTAVEIVLVLRGDDGGDDGPTDVL